MWREVPKAPFERWYVNRLVPAALRRAARIITISQSSERDILELWPELEEKVTVIPHGVSDGYLKNMSVGENVLGDVAPYLLYVGGVLERKRFAWAIEVLKGLENPTIQLLACGFTPDEAELCRHGLDDNIRQRTKFVSFTPNDNMPRLYREAVAVLYPTLYEGFGFPAVEAQAVGTPVVLSAVGSLKELVGPSTYVVPPLELTAWIDVLNRLIGERKESLAPDERARAWARKFSWDVSAAEHHKIYAEVVEGL
jgi:glycosyltransferase involved in cell wall biosynthesis